MQKPDKNFRNFADLSTEFFYKTEPSIRTSMREFMIKEKNMIKEEIHD